MEISLIPAVALLLRVWIVIATTKCDSVQNIGLLDTIFQRLSPLKVYIQCIFLEATKYIEL